MEERNRNTWIIVVVVAVVVLLLCCCLVIAGAIAASIFTAAPAGGGVGIGQVAESTEQVFVVDAAPTLEVDSFAGDITVRRGEEGRVRVHITRRARGSVGLNRISVDVIETDNRVEIRATHSGPLIDNTSAEVEVTVPVDA
ncbi:MAG: hypothetical protein ACP5HG_13830, partial [Anaerolineae bacterium]